MFRKNLSLKPLSGGSAEISTMMVSWHSGSALKVCRCPTGMVTGCGSAAVRRKSLPSRVKMRTPCLMWKYSVWYLSSCQSWTFSDWLKINSEDGVCHGFINRQMKVSGSLPVPVIRWTYTIFRIRASTAIGGIYVLYLLDG